ncbi:hypothetical protein BD410DRAFT_882711 [Rickenella mellea]|uniref:Uncharacterized protein n=1 Tax=Rickenella mellea TaxID=50990 RepID=A0A4Y7PQZ3_9AGAM|nr:hypothetical protein BD410DRAFT_882711 [Rickenella mellea]
MNIGKCQNPNNSTSPPPSDEASVSETQVSNELLIAEMASCVRLRGWCPIRLLRERRQLNRQGRLATDQHERSPKISPRVCSSPFPPGAHDIKYQWMRNREVGVKGLRIDERRPNGGEVTPLTVASVLSMHRYQVKEMKSEEVATPYDVEVEATKTFNDENQAAEDTVPEFNLHRDLCLVDPISPFESGNGARVLVRAGFHVEKHTKICWIPVIVENDRMNTGAQFSSDPFPPFDKIANRSKLSESKSEQLADGTEYSSTVAIVAVQIQMFLTRPRVSEYGCRQKALRD